MWEETGGDSPLALTHLYLQRAVLVKHTGIVETQQHLIIARRQLPFGGEGRHISCRDNRSATLRRSTLTPCLSGNFILVELAPMVQFILCSPRSSTVNGPAWPGPSRSTTSRWTGEGCLLQRLALLCLITGPLSFSSKRLTIRVPVPVAGTVSAGF